MNAVTYGIIEERYTLGNTIRISYSIAAYADPESEGTAVIIASARDVCCVRQTMEELVQRCNLLALSAIHLPDIIEDFLGL